MRVYGVDFTSRPGTGKAIHAASCWLDGDALRFERLERIPSLPAFEAFLDGEGPWVAGFDFPFTQSRRFLGNIGWPTGWGAYADHLGAMTRDAFRAALEAYKAPRPAGDREHGRAFERGTGAASPQKLYGVPVALMQFEGVPRLRRAGVHVPGLADGDRSRVAVEAYPGVAARGLIGATPYKTDERSKQTPGRLAARQRLLAALTGGAGQARFGLRVEAPGWLADDPGGDPLDALLCAVQAAWAWRALDRDPALLAAVDPVEGWIADPALHLAHALAGQVAPGDGGAAPAHAPLVQNPAAPPDAAARRAARPVVVYPTGALPPPPLALYARARGGATLVDAVAVPPRDARAVRVPAGHVLRIVCAEGPQVGDLNLFADGDLRERFFSGKTRALHGAHVTVGDRLWSCLPFLRPMATIIGDDLAWYGVDADGAGVHDVIGTRCDPYTQRLLGGVDYDRCCHSNLTRALAAATGMTPEEAEPHVHDVLNVFMCTGLTRDEGRYFMKASPVRAGDALELLAEIDLLALLSACPGGDCGSGHSSDAAPCHPLRLEVLAPAPGALDGWSPPARSGYAGRHGAGRHGA